MIKELFSTKGCIGRGEWWGIKAMLFLTYLVLVPGMNLFAEFLAEFLARDLARVMAVLGILVVFSVIIGGIYIEICANIKRLHDRNKSGWWVLLCLVPVVNFWLLIQCGFLRSVEESKYREE